MPYEFPKIDFPRFEGKDPGGWISKCEKFFRLNPSLDNRQRVVYAALHLDREADTWYQSVQLEYHDFLWVEFARLVCHMFTRGGYENLEGYLINLSRRGRWTITSLNLKCLRNI